METYKYYYNDIYEGNIEAEELASAFMSKQIEPNAIEVTIDRLVLGIEERLDSYIAENEYALSYNGSEKVDRTIQKFSYKDWKEGRIKANDVDELYETEAIATDTLYFIKITQALAYLNMLSEALHQLVITFSEGVYKISFVKETLLDEEISKIESELKYLKDEYPELHSKALRGEDERFSLESDEVYKAIYNGFYTLRDNDIAFTIIFKYKYLHWLLWLKNPNREKLMQPSFYEEKEYQTEWLARAYGIWEREVPPFKLKTRKTDIVSYSWPNLFKDPRQADKILVLLSEFLSDTGQWITGKSGRHLMALYSELKQKGYLKSVLSGANVACAFNQQFGTTLESRNFQPGELSKADDYRENFFSIPTYHPDTTP
jgi:hypothetical protein